MKKQSILTLILYSCLFLVHQIQCTIKTSINQTQVDDQNYKITLSFSLDKGESLFTNSINISTDNSNILLSDWKANNNVLFSNKEIDKNFSINLNAFINSEKEKEANIFVSYINNKNKINEETFKLNFEKPVVEEINPIQNNQNNITEINKSNTKSATAKRTFGSFLYKISVTTQELIKKSSSIWFQLFLVFILGLLMSFTPCIYPVISVTVGILQMQGSKSILYNFLLSISYSLGIATTFAVFGLTAAMGGHLFGQILAQPIFIIFITAFLVYLALSMFGFYEIYIPKFLQPSNNIKHKGSLLSAFIFGAVSGSIASPCLSPGLALLLTIVASLANKILGFLLLFSFGIGFSIPLIVIGTFSSSINMLPKAGMWMDEVKKIFGFLLIGMSFYYLSNILPMNIILFIIVISLFASGIYYFYSITKYDTKNIRIYKNFIGFLLIMASVFVGMKTIQKSFCNSHENMSDKKVWFKNYNEALEIAVKENKKLIIDIGAAYCTICKLIDQRVFNNPALQELFEKFVLVKVDATNPKNEPYFSIKQKYNKAIIGAPTILVINPANGDLIKSWGSELYDMSLEEISSNLQDLINLKH